jgi:hypothetical protein
VCSTPRHICNGERKLCSYACQNCVQWTLSTALYTHCCVQAKVTPSPVIIRTLQLSLSYPSPHVHARVRVCTTTVLLFSCSPVHTITTAHTDCLNAHMLYALGIDFLNPLFVHSTQNNVPFVPKIYILDLCSGYWMLDFE